MTAPLSPTTALPQRLRNASRAVFLVVDQAVASDLAALLLEAAAALEAAPIGSEDDPNAARTPEKCRAMLLAAIGRAEYTVTLSLDFARRIANALHPSGGEAVPIGAEERSDAAPKNWLLCPHCLHRWDNTGWTRDVWERCPSCRGSFSFVKPREIPDPSPKSGGEAADPASAAPPKCWHGHTTRQVGCVSCVLVFDRPADREAVSRPRAATPPPPDWDEFAVGAFLEGWAAGRGTEFKSLEEAWEWSHVRGQLGHLGADVRDFDSRIQPDPAVAPAADARAETPPQHPAHRWNIEPQDDGTLHVCRGEHDKALGCQWETYVPRADARAEPHEP